MYCSVLQLGNDQSPLPVVATWWSVLQCVAVCCRVLQCVAVRQWSKSFTCCCSVLQCVAVCCSLLECVAVPCS